MQPALISMDSFWWTVQRNGPGKVKERNGQGMEQNGKTQGMVWANYKWDGTERNGHQTVIEWDFFKGTVIEWFYLSFNRFWTVYEPFDDRSSDRFWFKNCSMTVPLKKLNGLSHLVVPTRTKIEQVIHKMVVVAEALWYKMCWSISSADVSSSSFGRVILPFI